MNTYLFIDERCGEIVGAAEANYSFQTHDKVKEFMNSDHLQDVLICKVETRLSIKVETHIVEKNGPGFDSASLIGELLNKPTAEEVREVQEAAPILVPFSLPAASTEHLEPL